LVGAVLVIAAVVIGMQRLNNGTAPQEAEVQMTPVVGGMTLATVPVPAGSGRGEPEVTATTGSLTTTGALSGTAAVSGSAPLSAAADLTGTTELSVTAAVSATATVSETVAAPTAQPTSKPTAVKTPTAEPQVTEVVPSPVFAAGEAVQAAGGRAALHAEPSEDAPVLDSYGPNVTLMVLEPGGDFSRYPVEVAGRGWVRVRAADGLVGWTPTAGLARAQ
jgi:hypothetical protein